MTRRDAAIAFLDALTLFTRETGYAVEGGAADATVAGRLTGARDSFVDLVFWDESIDAYRGSYRPTPACANQHVTASV